MIRVKICGITNSEDAKAAIDAGCDALGFVFYKKSKRYIRPKKAKEIILQLPERTIKIGVFANAQLDTIRKISRLCCLDMIQLHGNESPEFCARLKGYKIIKAIHIKNKKLRMEDLVKYKPFAFLFDSFTPTKLGGTGKTFNWSLLPHACELKSQIFLSGGLTQKNVKKAIKNVHPHWVDVSSSVELKPGKKDIKKVREFIKAAKGAHR